MCDENTTLNTSSTSEIECIDITSSDEECSINVTGFSGMEPNLSDSDNMQQSSTSADTSSTASTSAAVNIDTIDCSSEEKGSERSSADSASSADSSPICMNCKLATEEVYEEVLEDAIKRREVRAVLELRRLNRLNSLIIYVPTPILDAFLQENTNDLHQYVFPCGMTLLQKAFALRLYDKKDLLLKYVDCNTKITPRETLMTLAIENNDVFLVKLLVQYPATLYNKNGAGEIPIALAMKCQRTDIVEIIFPKMTQFENITWENKSLLHYAAEHNFFNIVEKLSQFLQHS